MSNNPGRPTRRRESALSGSFGSGRGTSPRPNATARPDLPAGAQQPAAGRRRGRDTDIWHLAELFRQYARADGIELTKGLPVIAAEINDLVAHYEMRGRDTIGSYPHMATGCYRRRLPEGLAARCWYHYPPQDPDAQRDGNLTWVQMVEVVMAEFWSRQWDEHALDHFRQHFAEYARAAIQHWRNLHIIRSIEAQPSVRRPVMRRATMSDATKEG
jgi:hypothetical protein